MLPLFCANGKNLHTQLKKPWLKTDTENLEKVQSKCLRLCSEPIDMDSLSFGRTFTDLVEMYKYMNNLYKRPAG